MHKKTEFSLKNIILKQSATMQEAIQVLNNESLRIVLFGVDDQKLLGTITNDDIRRELLRHLMMNNLESQVDTCFISGCILCHI